MQLLCWVFCHRNDEEKHLSHLSLGGDGRCTCAAGGLTRSCPLQDWHFWHCIYSNFRKQSRSRLPYRCFLHCQFNCFPSAARTPEFLIIQLSILVANYCPFLVTLGIPETCATKYHFKSAFVVCFFARLIFEQYLIHYETHYTILSNIYIILLKMLESSYLVAHFCHS
jgi:hypothetical protein